MQRPDEPYLRIGELGRRTGLTPELVRAWERRYGIIEPSRSVGGFRLYTDLDVERLLRMKAFVAQGVSAAQAASLARDAAPIGASTAEDASALPAIARLLWDSLERLDGAGADEALDRALSTFSLELVIRDLVLPYLRELGECWQRGESGIAQEHFASNLLRGRLLGLARGWGQGSGPRAVLACPPGERHDLGLLCFGLILRNQGWRVTYLGAETPIAVLGHLVGTLEPDLVVVSSVDEEPLRAAERALRRLAGSVALAIAGEGASDRLARRTGARLLEGDPVTAAHELAARIPA